MVFHGCSPSPALLQILLLLTPSLPVVRCLHTCTPWFMLYFPAAGLQWLQSIVCHFRGSSYGCWSYLEQVVSQEHGGVSPCTQGTLGLGKPALKLEEREFCEHSS